MSIISNLFLRAIVLIDTLRTYFMGDKSEKLYRYLLGKVKLYHTNFYLRLAYKILLRGEVILNSKEPYTPKELHIYLCVFPFFETSYMGDVLVDPTIVGPDRQVYTTVHPTKITEQIDSWIKEERARCQDPNAFDKILETEETPEEVLPFLYGRIQEKMPDKLRKFKKDAQKVFAHLNKRMQEAIHLESK